MLAGVPAVVFLGTLVQKTGRREQNFQLWKVQQQEKAQRQGSVLVEEMFEQRVARVRQQIGVQLEQW